MKKKIFAILLVIAMTFTLVACTPNMKAYMEATEKVSEWKGMETTGDINYEINITNPENAKENLKVNIPVKITGKTMGSDMAEVNMAFSTKGIKDLVANEVKKTGEQTPEELANIPDSLNLKMFVNKDKVYVNTEVLKLISPEFKNIKEDYILLPTTSFDQGFNAKAINYMNSQEFRSDLIKLMDSSLKDFKPSIDYKVEGNTYTLEATTDELLNDVSNGVEALNKNWDSFATDTLAILEKLGIDMTEEEKKDFKEAKGEFDKAEFTKQISEAKETLKGSKFKEKSTFEDNKYTANAQMDFKVAGFMNIKATVNGVSTRNDDVKLTVPTSVKELTEDELTKLMFPDMEPVTSLRVNGETVNFEDAMPMVKNDRTMVPFRALLEKLGAKVEWDQNTKTVKATKDDMNIELAVGKNIAKVNGKEVKLDAPAFIENDRTYIPARFISENLGYKVKYEKISSFLNVVDVYNIKDEELPAAIEKAEKAEIEKIQKEMEEMQKDSKETKETKEVKDDKVTETAKDAAKLIFNFVK